MNKSQPFRQHQLTRALKAAQAAGGANPHVRVVLPNGTQLFLSGGEVQEAPPKKSTPLRAVLAKGATRKCTVGGIGL